MKTERVEIDGVTYPKSLFSVLLFVRVTYLFVPFLICILLNLLLTILVLADVLLAYLEIA